jgi:hypothetical protein
VKVKTIAKGEENDSTGGIQNPDSASSGIGRQAASVKSTVGILKRIDNDISFPNRVSLSDEFNLSRVPYGKQTQLQNLVFRESTCGLRVRT